jgi:hypothetical protein
MSLKRWKPLKTLVFYGYDEIERSAVEVMSDNECRAFLIIFFFQLFPKDLFRGLRNLA